MTRPTIDNSAADLELVMTEGDPVGFNFLVLNEASWASSTFRCHVKAERTVAADVLADLSIVCTAEGLNVDVLIEGDASALVATVGRYWWDMQEDGGFTRFGGPFLVRPQVTA